MLDAVEAIPPGRVASYSDLAGLVGRGGPRQVGQVMARHGAAVPWWRVVHADGSLIAGLEARARAELEREGTPMRGDRIDMRRARFFL